MYCTSKFKFGLNIPLEEKESVNVEGFTATFGELQLKGRKITFFTITHLAKSKFH